MSSPSTPVPWLWDFPTWRHQSWLLSEGTGSAAASPWALWVFFSIFSHPAALSGKVGGWKPARSAAQCVHEVFHFLFLMGPGFRDQRVSNQSVNIFLLSPYCVLSPEKGRAGTPIRRCKCGPDFGEDPESQGFCKHSLNTCSVPGTGSLSVPATVPQVGGLPPIRKLG